MPGIVSLLCRYRNDMKTICDLNGIINTFHSCCIPFRLCFRPGGEWADRILCLAAAVPQLSVKPAESKEEGKHSRSKLVLRIETVEDQVTRNSIMEEKKED